MIDDWGLSAIGPVSPSTVLSYRTMWNSYVLDTVRCAQGCAAAVSAVADKQTDASIKAELSGQAQAVTSQAAALLARWNIYANVSTSFIVLQGASILESFQQTVLDAGQLRQNITTGTLNCSLTYVNDQGAVTAAVPGADPNVQAQVIALIEGQAILAAGVLQILVETGDESLQVAGSAAQWTARQVGNITSALATPWPWVAVTAVAGAVIAYELWPRRG